jgi:hypothetical protein
MPSQVNPSLINSQYPVPGVNQPSQGFRTNFLAIQNSFAQYVTEMNDVISKVIVSAPLLYGSNNFINNFGGMENSNLALVDFALVTSNISVSSSNAVPTLNFSNTVVANIHISASATSTQTINVSNFPAFGYSEIILNVIADSTPQYLNFANITPDGSVNTIGGKGIAGFNASTANFAITTTNPYQISLGSLDGVNYILDTPTSAVAKFASPTTIGQPGDTAGMIAYDANYMYVCTANYNGSTNIWKKVSIA